MRIKFDPKLILAFTSLVSYFSKVRIIKYIIVKPLRFIFSRFGLLTSKFFSIFKLYRKVSKAFSLFNIGLFLIFFLAYNDFTFEDVLILCALIYTRLFDIINNNIFGYIFNIFNIVKKRLLDLFDPLKVENVKSKVDRLEYPGRPDGNLFNSTESNYINSKYTYLEDKPKSSFYKSPYFYIPCGLILTGFTFYYYYDTLSVIALNGIMSYFGFNDDLPKPGAGGDKFNWMKDPGPSKPSILDTIEQVSSAPSAPIPTKSSQPFISANFEDRLRGVMNPSWTRPSSPALSDTSAISIETLGKGKGKA